MSSQQARVLMQLREMILRGDFAAGERMAEIPLAERLGSSRTPVRLALSSLEHEGLIEPASGGGYQMRQFTATEISDAIKLRGVLEGYAARLLAESGVSKPVLRSMHQCLEAGDQAVGKETMSLEDYEAYVEMNDRLHDLIVKNCGNSALIHVMETLNAQPFAAPSAMLPMQASVKGSHELMRHAQRTHHSMVEAIEQGQGVRAQALGEEHVQVARMNLESAMEDPELMTHLSSRIRLVG